MSVHEHPSVAVWRHGDIWIERYGHVPGPTAPVATHAHAEYQFGLSLDAAGEYLYRGARHPIAPGSLRLIQPGEMHASRDFGADRPLTTYLLYFPSALLHDLVTQLAGVPVVTPVFPSPVVDDPALATMFRALCRSIVNEPMITGPTLASDSRLLATLTAFIERHAERRVVATAAGREPDAVATAREYLLDHLDENVSLSRLAALVGLTPHYLDRAFAKAVGIPPHRYQTQLRVLRAKDLLATGLPIDTVALRSGFADQSHLGRHFKRLVGVTPGRYRLEQRPHEREEHA